MQLTETRLQALDNHCTVLRTMGNLYIIFHQARVIARLDCVQAPFGSLRRCRQLLLTPSPRSARASGYPFSANFRGGNDATPLLHRLPALAEGLGPQWCEPAISPMIGWRRRASVPTADWPNSRSAVRQCRSRPRLTLSQSYALDTGGLTA